MKNYWTSRTEQQIEERAHTLALAISERFRHLILEEVGSGRFLEEEFNKAVQEEVVRELLGFDAGTASAIADLEHEIALLKAELRAERG